MFTVKLVRHYTTKLVEAQIVEIYPAGKPEPRPEHISNMDCPGGEKCHCPAPCTNKVKGISVELFGNRQVFHIGDDPSQAMGDVDLYDHAFIENSEGATTERVYGQR